MTRILYKIAIGKWIANHIHWDNGKDLQPKKKITLIFFNHEINWHVEKQDMFFHKQKSLIHLCMLSLKNGKNHKTFKLLIKVNS